MGRTVKVILPDGAQAESIYGDWEKTSIDPEGGKKKEYYDAYGKLVKVEELNGAETYVTSYENDMTGRLRKTIDNNGNVILTNFDSLSRKVSIQDPDMGNWTYT